MERQPVQFFVRDLEGLIDEARRELAQFIGAPEQALAWVPNTTTGVNAVLRSMPLSTGDELLVTDHEYNACRNTLDFVAQRAGARVVQVTIPLPVSSPDEVVAAIVEKVTPRTRLALIDHVTSQTGMILPVDRLVAELAEKGVDTLIDGAHAPGMLDLNVAAIGAAYYTGNCHKWLCAPKGAGFLYVRPDLQSKVRPVTISHAANSPRTDRSRYLMEFDWVGTDDPTAALCVPTAIRFMGKLLPGGWAELRRSNRDLALQARREIATALDVAPPSPDSMVGSLASIRLPPGDGTPSPSPLYTDPLQDLLLERWSIEVPVIPWPAPPERWIRISAQIYNRPDQYQRLAAVLSEIFS